MASYAQWQYVLTDLQGRQIAEVLNCTQRQLIRSLSATSVASFTILANNAVLSAVLTMDLNLKIYRNGTLMFHGPVVSSELATDDATATPTVQVSAADPSWRFAHRVAGKSNAPNGVLFNGSDRLSIAESLINTTNSEAPATTETGVQTLGQTCGSTAVYLVQMKPLDQCIAEMSQTTNGFDWRIDPIEYTVVGSGWKIGNFKAAALLGSQQNSAVFEYQGKANARSPNYQRSITEIANRVFSIPDGGPASALGVMFAEDTASQTARGLYEEVIDTSGIDNATLRGAVLNDHITYRATPKQVVSFAPDFNDYSGRVPEYGTDYQIGDTVRASIIYNGTRLVDGFVRLYRMQFDIDQNGKETLTPTVVNETS